MNNCCSFDLNSASMSTAQDYSKINANLTYINIVCTAHFTGNCKHVQLFHVVILCTGVYSHKGTLGDKAHVTSRAIGLINLHISH